MWKHIKKTVHISTEEESTKRVQMINWTSHNKVTSALTKIKVSSSFYQSRFKTCPLQPGLALKSRKKNNLQSEKRWAPASIRQVIGTTGATNNSSPFFVGSGRVWEGKGCQDSESTFCLQNYSKVFIETWQWRCNRQMYGNVIQLKIRSRKSLAGNPNSYSNFTNFSPLLKQIIIQTKRKHVTQYS